MKGLPVADKDLIRLQINQMLSFELGKLAAKGSLFVTRPTLLHYMRDRRELLDRANDLFNWIAAGQLKLTIDKSFPLAQAAEAHRQLEARKTVGKVLLIP